MIPAMGVRVCSPEVSAGFEGVKVDAGIVDTVGLEVAGERE